MNALRTIVCPIELSECSTRALRQAKALADLHGADLAVVAVHPTSARGGLWFPRVAAVPEAAADAAAWDDAVWSFVHDAIGAAHVRVLARSGPVVPTILAETARLAGDLIVMCAEGDGRFAGLTVASTASRIVSTAPCPVLTLPREPGPGSDGSWRTVLCGIDGSASSHRVIHAAERIAVRCTSRLVVAHVLPDPAARSGPELRDACERLIPPHLGRRCEVRLVITHGSPHEELGRLAAAWDAGLIVVGRRAAVSADAGVVQRVIGSVPCGVLAVPQPQSNPAEQPGTLVALPAS